MTGAAHGPAAGAATGTLLVGWRPGVTYLLEELGQKVTCVLEPGDVARARQEDFRGDLIVVPDAGNAEYVLAGLERAGRDPGSFHAVCTNQELSLVTASIIGGMGGARCIPARTAVLLRDKPAQKAAIREAGLPVASCCVIDSLGDLTAEARDYPVVVKRAGGCDTADTFAVRTAAEAAELSASRPGREGYGPWAVEEFMHGAELEIDGVVRDGELVFLSISRYLRNLITIKDGNRYVGALVLSPDSHAGLYRQVRPFAAKALACLGHTDGIFHLEAFLQGDRLAFSECAGRSGGGMIREAIREKFGVEIVGEWARASLGVPHAIPARPASDLHFGWIHLITPPGRLVSVPGREQILGMPGVTIARMNARPGDVMKPNSTSSGTRAGGIIIAMDTEPTIESALMDVADWFYDTAVAEQ